VKPLAPLRALALAAFLASLAPLGCDQFGSSKVAQGQRYSSGDTRYDPYFESVHQQQVAAAAWPDEKKAARRGLVATLALTPGASDDAIVSATRERAKKLGGQGAKLDLGGPRVTPTQGATSDGALFSSIEECARAEQERAKKLKATSEKLEEMAKQGEALKKESDKEFENSGAQKADEEKQKKRREIRRELGGSVEALRSLARDATRAARDIDEFLGDLGSALEAKDTPSRGRGGSMGSDRRPSSSPPPPPPKEDPKPAKAEAPKEEPKHTDSGKKPAKPAENAGKKPAKPADKPAEKPADKPAEKPAEKPAQPAKPPDEVFNP